MLDRNNPLPEDVLQAIENNRKVEAIKLLKDQQDLGLAEAKERVESHIAANPRLVEAQRSSRSSRVTLIAIVGIIIIVIAVINQLFSG